MGRIWTFLKEPQNLAVIVALAGGLGFLWKEVIAPKPAVALSTVAVSAPRQQATAAGGVAVSAAGQAQVNVENTLTPVSGPGQIISPSTPSVILWQDKVDLPDGLLRAFAARLVAEVRMDTMSSLAQAKARSARGGDSFRHHVNRTAGRSTVIGKNGPRWQSPD
jgi:hypothetical protein